MPPEHEVARSNRAGWAIYSFIKYQSDNNLSLEKGAKIMHIDETDLDISIVPTPLSKIGQAEFGVEIKHKPTGLVVTSVHQKSQYLNKIEALRLLNLKLSK